MESDNWLTIGDTCRKANCSKEKVQRLILEGVIPPSCIRTVDGVTRLPPNVASSLKNQKSAWLNNEHEQPANAIHVEDPDGVYPGFWLTPEQAITLAEIRVKKRLHGNGDVHNTKTRKGNLSREIGLNLGIR